MNKNRNNFRYQSTNFPKCWFLFLVSIKRQKGDESEFVNKFVKNKVTIVFMNKYLSNS